MSDTQGVYDLALTRPDHDMYFPIASQTTSAVHSEWDDGASLWDVVEVRSSVQSSVWDAAPGTVVERHSIFPINGADKVAQQVKITLLAFLGEWFLDVTFGMPYLEDILVKNPAMATVETIFRAHINAVPHVIRIDNLVMSWDRARRNMSVEFSAATDYGPIKDSVRLDTPAHV